MKYSMLALFLMLSLNTYSNECNIDASLGTKTEETSRTQNFVNKILNNVRCVGQGGMLAHTHKRIAIGVGKNLNKKTKEKSSQEKFEIKDPAHYFQDSENVSFSRTADGDVFILNETENGRELIAFLCERHGVDYSQLQSIEISSLTKPKRAKECRYKQFTGSINLQFQVDDKTFSLPKNGKLNLIDKLGENDLTYKVDGLCYDANSTMGAEPCLLYFLTNDPIKKTQYQLQCELSKKN
ncbi:MAG: hypothetical protein JNM93_00095 [Bacteriovoracaceae bacterium]|nr:hypothetical protein [Bacteriovoracaceae bacterium]